MPTTNATQPIPGGFYDLLNTTNAAVEYNSLFGGTQWNDTAAKVWMGTSPAGTIKNFSVNLYDATGVAVSPGAGNSYTFTIVYNGVASLSVAIADTDTTGSNTSTLSITQGPGSICIKCVTGNAGGINSAYAVWSAEFTPSTAGECWVPTGVRCTEDGVRYACVYGRVASYSQSGVSAERVAFPCAGTFKRMDVKLSDNAGSGSDDYEIRLMKYGVGTPIYSVDLVTPSTSGSDTGDAAVAEWSGTYYVYSLSNEGTPANNVYAAVGLTFDTGIAGKTVMICPGLANTDINNNDFYSLFDVNLGNVSSNASEYKTVMRVPKCYISKWYVSDGLCTAGDQWDFYLRDDGVNTLHVVQTAGGNTSPTTTTQEIEDGSLVCIQAVPTASPLPSGISSAMEIWNVAEGGNLITSIIHRYDRNKRIYQTECVIGGVTSDFGFPDWSNEPAIYTEDPNKFLQDNIDALRKVVDTVTDPLSDFFQNLWNLFFNRSAAPTDVNEILPQQTFPGVDVVAPTVAEFKEVVSQKGFLGTYKAPPTFGDTDATDKWLASSISGGNYRAASQKYGYTADEIKQLLAVMGPEQVIQYMKSTRK